jgi:hypothetical protein
VSETPGSARAKGRVIAIVGATASIALFLAASWHSPLVLKFLIGAWVIAPFAGYFGALKFFPRSVVWLKRAVLTITLISLVAYAHQVFGSGFAKAAAPFVVVPVISWILLFIAIIAGRLSKSSA